MGNFFYRQRQRIKYHLAGNEVGKRIAEINRHTELVKLRGNQFLVIPLGTVLPVNRFSFIIQSGSFDLFISNAKRLNGTYSLQDNLLIFSFADLNIEITSASELFIINEIFVNKCYNFNLPGTDEVFVIDIGMNVGLASLFFASHPQVHFVYGYEPFIPTIKKARNNFNLNPLLKAKIIIHEYGLGSKNEMIKANYNPDNLGINSSVHFNSNKFNGLFEEILEIRQADIELTRLFQASSNKKFVIKIDTEGAEYSIFESLFIEKLHESIVAFFIEWHFKGPADLECKLINAGFKLVSFSLGPETGLIYAFR